MMTDDDVVREVLDDNERSKATNEMSFGVLEIDDHVI